MAARLYSAKGGNRPAMNLKFSFTPVEVSAVSNLLLNLSILLPVTVFGLSLSPVARAEPLQQSARCKNAIARVITGGIQNFRAGDLLCPEDRVFPVQGQQPKIVCRRTRKVLAGQTGRVGDLCGGQPKSTFIRRGTSDALILNARGNEVEPKLIKPFGSVMIEQRPHLVWLPTKGATHYSIRIDGYNLKLEQTVPVTQFSYPQSWPALEYGNVYDINIFAYQGDKIISADRTTVNLLFEKDAMDIRENIAAIKQLSLPLSEVALDLDAVYMSRNLLDESIQLLQGLREKGKSNQKLNRILADRYLQAGWPDFANSTVQEAQLPTKIKLPQK